MTVNLPTAFLEFTYHMFLKAQAEILCSLDPRPQGPCAGQVSKMPNQFSALLTTFNQSSIKIAAFLPVPGRR